MMRGGRREGREGGGRRALCGRVESLGGLVGGKISLIYVGKS